MTASTVPRHVTFAISNPGALQQGCTPRHRFDRSGGTIGSRAANWILVDRGGGIDPIHCEICEEDGGFCVVDRSGRTHINGSRASMGKGVGARLHEGDTLQIGPYDLTVHLDADDALIDVSAAGVAELLGGGEGDIHVAGPFLTPALSAQPGADPAAFRELAAPAQRREDLDPLHALEVAGREMASSALDPLDSIHYGLAPSQTQANLAATRFEAVSGAPKTVTGDRTMTRPRTDTTPVQHWLSTQQAAGGDPRQWVAPLQEGLGAPVGAVDEQAAYRLLLEAGQALRAAIDGLSVLYRSAGSEDRLALMGRTLQPIEDNPLRLGLNYEDTVRALFGSERSVVHLSPKAAVEESLTQVRRHQAAVVQAISASLDALLRTFSPEVLLQRFQRYRPQDAQPSDTDWAWQMYSHYYNELASSRQMGFEKLFWEVFEQVYDRALREEAR